MPRPRQFDEKRVLSSVQAAFWDKGYAGTSLDDLLAASGLGKGSLYGAFGDKRSLFLRVLREYDDANDAMLRTRLEQSDRAVDVVRDFVTDPLRDPDGAEARRGCLLANTAMELSADVAEVAAEARRSYAATTTLLAEAVRRAQREGDVAPTSTPTRPPTRCSPGNSASWSSAGSARTRPSCRPWPGPCSRDCCPRPDRLRRVNNRGGELT